MQAESDWRPPVSRQRSAVPGVDDSRQIAYRTVENHFQAARRTGKSDPPPVSRSIATAASVWVFERCGGNNCVGSNVAPILKFDASGKLVKSFGAGMFIRPHGIHVDRDGNVWVTDGEGPDGKDPERRQRTSGVQVQPGRQGPDDARQGGRRRRRTRHLQHARPTFSWRRTATSSSPTATAATRTRASSSSRRTASSSRHGERRAPRPATSRRPTPWRWTRGAGCSSATAGTTGSRSSTRTEVPRGVEAVRPAERRIHRQERHDLRRRSPVGSRRRTRDFTKGITNRKRQGRQGDRVHPRSRSRRFAGRRDG